MELKCCKGCDKKCWILLIGIALIVVGAVLYYLTTVYQPKELGISHPDIQVNCEDPSTLDVTAKAELETELEEMYGVEGFTMDEMESMLPSGCTLVLIIKETPARKAGKCLVLENELCDELSLIVYQGRDALGFNALGGRPIFAPADGIYSDNYTGETINEGGEELTLLPTRIEFRPLNSDSFLYFDGLFQSPDIQDGESVSKGEIIGYTAQTNRYLDEVSQSNFIIIYSDPEIYELIIFPSLPAE
ncbi:MAG: hypothetical protein PHV43_02685 [Candidatus Colwellbacteria bacterium]|nr:hypothetical protein [Candidatus Colwellbacteria bacterium]